MKKLFLIVVLCLCGLSVYAEESVESYAYHSFTVNDRDFNVQEDYNGDGKPLGLIINAEIDGTKMIGITLGEETVYEVQVVNIEEEYDSQNGQKWIMYQGGMKFNDEIVVLNVIFVYDMAKNTNIPETVLVDVHNSPTIMELSGLVQLNRN